jgi:DNA-binding LacI/PurR family transcriptional regulator
MATGKDVANLAGVSASTVSRALSEKLFVQPETRARVMAAVEKLGYHPNMMAKGLKEGRTRTLALVVPGIMNMYFPKVVQGVEKYARENDYTLILYSANESLEQERLAVESARKNHAAGIIVSTVSEDIRHILALKR